MAEAVDAQELLIAGYVRELESKCKFPNIPTEINDIIHSYRRFCDVWNQKYSNDSFTIDHISNKLISDIFFSGDCGTAYGTQVVGEGIFNWKIKTISYKYNMQFISHPYIGLIEDDEHILLDHSDQGSWQSYGFQFTVGAIHQAYGDTIEHDIMGPYR